MGQEEFEIEIDRNGKVTVRTIGIKGAKCIEAAEMLAKIVGTEESRTLTNEYYESESSVTNHIDVRQGY